MSIPLPLTQSLNSVIDVVVSVSPQAAPRTLFNQALFIGTAAHLSSQTVRIKRYDANFATEMVADGFATTDPEYIAANLYFGQEPTPQYLWIGRQDLTALNDTACSVDAGGTLYAVGDILTVAGGTNGRLQVLTVNSGTGAVLTVGIASPTSLYPYPNGTGYSASTTGAATTTNSQHGSSCTISFATVGESCVDALAYCRATNFDWYDAVCLAAVDADHLACAAYMQSASPVGTYFFTTNDASALNGVAGNIGLELQALSYSRTLGQYATTQGGAPAAAANPYAVCSLLGYAEGQDTGLANSAYTLKFKQEIGINPEPLTPTQINNIQSANLNYYGNWGNYYNWLIDGRMSNGSFYDQTKNLDILSSMIQLNVADLLNGNPKIPLTDTGVSALVHAVNQACQQAVTTGFLAPGVFTGATAVMKLNPGDAIPLGYITQAMPVSSLSNAQLSARQAPPIYCVIQLAGAIHSCVINVQVSL